MVRKITAWAGLSLSLSLSARSLAQEPQVLWTWPDRADVRSQALAAGLGVAGGAASADFATNDRGEVFVARWAVGTLRAADVRYMARYSPAGRLEAAWGPFSDQSTAPPGVFSLWNDGEPTSGRLAVDPDGNVHVLNRGYCRVQKFDRDGNVLGTYGSCGDGFGQFRSPGPAGGIAATPTGEILVHSIYGDRVQVFTVDGDPVREWSDATVTLPDPPCVLGPDFGVGDGAAVDPRTGDVLLVEHRLGQAGCPHAFEVALWVLRFAEDGTPLQGFPADASGCPGPTAAPAARTTFGLTDIVVDATGAIYVYDSLDGLIKRFDEQGNCLVAFGAGLEGRALEQARVDLGRMATLGASGIGLTPDGNVLVHGAALASLFAYGSIDLFGAIHEFTPWGALVRVIPRANQTAAGAWGWDPKLPLAVDVARGRVYLGVTSHTPVAPTWVGRILVFDLEGNPLDVWTREGRDPGGLFDWLRSGGGWMSVDPGTGRLAVANRLPPDVTILDPFGRVLRRIDMSPIGPPGAGAHPRGLQYDRDGNLYVATQAYVLKMSPDGTPLWTVQLDRPPGSPFREFPIADVALVPDGRVLVLAPRSDKFQLARLTPEGQLLGICSTPVTPLAVGVRASIETTSDGRLLLSQAFSALDIEPVVEINADCGLVGPLFARPGGVDHMAADTGGGLFITYGDSVERLGPLGGPIVGEPRVYTASVATGARFPETGEIGARVTLAIKNIGVAPTQPLAARAYVIDPCFTPRTAHPPAAINAAVRGFEWLDLPALAPQESRTLQFEMTLTAPGACTVGPHLYAYSIAPQDSKQGPDCLLSCLVASDSRDVIRTCMRACPLLPAFDPEMICSACDEVGVCTGCDGPPLGTDCTCVGCSSCDATGIDFVCSCVADDCLDGPDCEEGFGPCAWCCAKCTFICGFSSAACSLGCGAICTLLGGTPGVCAGICGAICPFVGAWACPSICKGEMCTGPGKPCGTAGCPGSGGGGGGGAGGGVGGSGDAGSGGTPPLDPNAKVASGRFVGPDQPILYGIQFENIGGAPARDVFVTDVLDAGLDETTLDVLTAGGAYEPATRTLRWELLGLNLAPRDGGAVAFAIRPRGDLDPGAVIRDAALIVFDGADPLETAATETIYDPEPPASSVSAPPFVQGTGALAIPLTWAADDFGLSGVATIEIFGSRDGEPFVSLGVGFADSTGDLVPVEPGHEYAFFSVATDNVGNVEAAPAFPDAATVVSANRAPVAVCTDVTVAADADCQAEGSVDAGSSDPDGDAVLIAQEPAGLYGLGATLVTLTVSDGRLAATCEAVVTVVDATPPTVDAGPDIFAECSSPDGTPVDLSAATVFDNCDAALVAIPVDAPATYPLGTTVVRQSATDSAGNVGMGEVDVIVHDTISPSLSLSASPSVLWPPNHGMVPIAVEVDALDVCDASPGTSLVSAQSSELDDAPGGGDGHTTGDVQATSVSDIALRAERAGSGAGRLYTLSFAATDASGNSTERATTIVVPHNQ